MREKYFLTYFISYNFLCTILYIVYLFEKCSTDHPSLHVATLLTINHLNKGKLYIAQLNCYNNNNSSSNIERIEYTQILPLPQRSFSIDPQSNEKQFKMVQEKKEINMCHSSWNRLKMTSTYKINLDERNNYFHNIIKLN